MAGAALLSAAPGAQSAAIGDPWAREDEASSIVQALASLGLDFPPAGAGEATWDSFEHAAFKVPGVLVVLGTCTAFALPAILCCCPPPRWTKGSPPWSGFVLAALLTAACLTTGLSACLELGARSLASAGKEVRAATSEVWKAKRYTTALNASGVAVLEDLALMYEACPQDAQDYLGNSVSGIESSVRRYNEVAVRLTDTIISMPHRLIDAQKTGLSMGDFYSWNMALPSLLLVALCCGVIAAAVAIQEWAGPKVARRCERCQMPFVSLVCVAPVMVLLCTAASAELSFGIQLAAFCNDADAITLEYAAQELGNDTYGFNMTRYYLTGVGSNEAATARVTGDSFFPASAQDEIKAAGGAVKVYEGLDHGFMVRGDFANNTKVNDAANEAFDMAVAHMKKACLRKPKYVKVESLKPTSRGFNVIIKVAEEPKAVEASGSTFTEVLCGDESGAFLLSMKDSQKEGIAKDTVLTLRNASVRMVEGHIRVVVDKWGKLDLSPPEKAPEEVKTSNNLSATEYELAAA